MFDVADSLKSALANANSGLSAAANATARSQTSLGPPNTDVALAGAASRAVFTEALLAAVHARLSEIKSVTHG